MRTAFTQLIGRFFAGVIIWGAITIPTDAATLRWGASPDESSGKVAGYKVYYSKQAFSMLPSDAGTNPNFTVVTVPVGQNSVALNSLTSGATYYVAVAAYGADSTQSAPSNVVTFMAGVPLTAPPSNLRPVP